MTIWNRIKQIPRAELANLPKRIRIGRTGAHQILELLIPRCLGRNRLMFEPHELTRGILAKSCGCSPTSVSRYIKELHRKGYLRIIYHKTAPQMNAPNQYMLTKKFWELMAAIWEETQGLIFQAMALKARKFGVTSLVSNHSKHGSLEEIQWAHASSQGSG